jgi:hypothetical protein
MSLRTVLLLAALATAAPACVVHVTEPGAVTSDGSVYLGFDLFSGKGKSDRERIDVGQQLGAFSTIRLNTDESIALSQVVVIFADGERFKVPVPAKLGGGRWTEPVALPRGPRPIHSVVVTARSLGKHLAKIEIYGTH